MTVFRWIFAVLVIGVVVMMAMKSLKPQLEPPTQVTLAKAEKMTVTRTVTAAGKVEPLRKVNVSSNITGTLVDLKVGIGSLVKTVTWRRRSSLAMSFGSSKQSPPSPTVRS